MENEQKIIVSCPKCGQKLKCVAGGVGTCPKCGEKVHFPNENPIIDIFDESRSKDAKSDKNTDSFYDSQKYNGDNFQKSKNAKYGCLFMFICALIIVISIFGISMLGDSPGSGDRCTICGGNAVYTTSSGEGLCVQHLFDGLTYLDRHN